MRLGGNPDIVKASTANSKVELILHRYPVFDPVPAVFWH
jgi:hypothetical protein